MEENKIMKKRKNFLRESNCYPLLRLKLGNRSNVRQGRRHIRIQQHEIELERESRLLDAVTSSSFIDDFS